MRLILAKVIWHFDLALAPEHDQADWFDQKAWAVWWKKPLWVKVSVASH